MRREQEVRHLDYICVGLWLHVITSSLLLCMSELCVQSSSVSVGLEYTEQVLFFERLQCSQVSELVTSLNDVASTDIESSDTATESPD